MDELHELKIISARVGADPLLVQAAGGNTSLKRDGVMWIKASGTWLRDALDKDIFVPVDVQKLLVGIKENDPACETCAEFVRKDLNSSALRPSIETAVHAMMQQRVVIHVHCVNTIAWAIQENALNLLRKKLAAFSWAFVPYVRPGLFLAAAIAQQIKPDTNILVLGNHGLVVAGDTVAEAELLLEQVVACLALPTRELLAVDFLALDELCRGTNYAPALRLETHALATDAEALNRAKDFVFYPDHVVFLGTGIATEISSGAPLVALRGVGVVIHKDAKPAVEPLGRCLAEVMRRITAGQKIVALTANEIGQLTNWDAEKYRQGLSG